MSIQRKVTVLLSAWAAGAALNGASASASETSESLSVSVYQMAAVIDRARGDIVLAGDYGQAIDKLGARNSRGFESSTNLCVAYTMTGELEKADAECVAALTESRRTAVRRDIAVALSNLGVVKAVNGDLSGAQRDFSRALELKSDLYQASKNLELLRRRGLVDA